MNGKKVFKYPLEGITGIQLVLIPKEARILSVQNQYDVPTIWALVDPEVATEQRRFYIIGTGGPTPEYIDSLTFLGTIQTHGGRLVWHIFVDPGA